MMLPQPVTEQCDRCQRTLYRNADGRLWCPWCWNKAVLYQRQSWGKQRDRGR